MGSKTLVGYNFNLDKFYVKIKRNGRFRNSGSKLKLRCEFFVEFLLSFIIITEADSLHQPFPARV